MTRRSAKSGEIFRSDDGLFSFVCAHCDEQYEDCKKAIDHINSHFITCIELDSDDSQPPEIIICTGIPADEEQSEIEMEGSDVEVESSENEVVNVDEIMEETSGSETKNSHTSTLSDLSIQILEPETTNLPTTGSERKFESQYLIKRASNSKQTTIESNVLKRKADLGTATRGWRFGEKYKIIYDNEVATTSSFSKKSIKHLPSTRPKCYQCEMEPPIIDQSHPRRHKCVFCKLWFPNHNEFKVHFKEAHSQDVDEFFCILSNCNEFTCYVCEKNFPLRYYLAAHMKTHHDKFLEHQCPTCGNRFRTYGILTQHLKTHEGKIFKCNECSKEFPYNARLRRHSWCHKTELNYVCEVCKKGFKMRKYLNVHMAMHNTVKKYECRYCESRFSFTSGRRSHEKSQHNAL